MPNAQRNAFFQAPLRRERKKSIVVLIDRVRCTGQGGAIATDLRAGNNVFDDGNDLVHARRVPRQIQGVRARDMGQHGRFLNSCNIVHIDHAR